MLLNHEPRRQPSDVFGRGPRYWRFDPELAGPLALDDTSEPTLRELSAAAAQMIEERSADLDALVTLLETGMGTTGLEPVTPAL